MDCPGMPEKFLAFYMYINIYIRNKIASKDGETEAQFPKTSQSKVIKWAKRKGEKYLESRDKQHRI